MIRRKRHATPNPRSSKSATTKHSQLPNRLPTSLPVLLSRPPQTFHFIQSTHYTISISHFVSSPGCMGLCLSVYAKCIKNVPSLLSEAHYFIIAVNQCRWIVFSTWAGGLITARII